MEAPFEIFCVFSILFMVFSAAFVFTGILKNAGADHPILLGSLLDIGFVVISIIIWFMFF